jgi:hypothetical protein
LLLGKADKQITELNKQFQVVVTLCGNFERLAAKLISKSKRFTIIFNFDSTGQS